MVTHQIKNLSLEDEHGDHGLVKCVFRTANDTVDALQALLVILGFIVQVCHIKCNFDLQLPLLLLDLIVLSLGGATLSDGPPELPEDLVIVNQGFFDLAVPNHLANIIDLVLVRLHRTVLYFVDICTCILLLDVRY